MSDTPLTTEISLLIFGRIAVGALSLVLIYATAAPMLPSQVWWIRIFDFPRVQIAGIMGIVLVSYVALGLFMLMRPWEYALLALLGLALVWQSLAIAPYTSIYSKQMADSTSNNTANRISILVYNVLYDNTEVEALRDLIREHDPDLILLCEPTQWWLEQLDGLQDDYPYTLHQPQENEYGKLLYSRLELLNPEVRFLIESDVPSLHTQLRLRSGTLVTFYGLHPRPPGIKREDEGGERQDSDARDAELLVVAREVEERGDVPVIVAGDFNDVGWSSTTRLFQRTGKLLDPRVGRGFFNTFDTRSRLLRYPLDHVFASRHFLLGELRRLPDIGSDHFPILVVLDYDPGAVSDDEPQPDAGDEQEADEAIEEGKSEN